MKHIIVILLIVLVIVLCCQSYYEGFTPYGPYVINEFKGGNFITPPGVNANPGEEQMVQNATAASVASAPSGNPQNLWPEYKRQP
jgi:hypothetical protein